MATNHDDSDITARGLGIFMRKNWKIDWVPFVFLMVTPLLVLILLPLYFLYFELTWPIVALTLFFWFATSFSITAGYHRLFAHRSYKAKRWVEFVLLFFGAGAFQNSALKWCSEHRIHHKHVDTDNDPYSAKRGAFYSHIGWMLINEGKNLEYAEDLKRNPLVKHQHDHYLSWAIVAGAATPILLGWALGDAVGGFVFAFLVRMVGVHHATFFVNSLAHIMGKQTYSDKHTAKDSFVVALLTNGEGYHNFHHTFEGDYRNGIKWYHWDPTKWGIRLMSWFGQTYNLKKVPHHRIILESMKMRQQKLAALGVNTSKLEGLREKFDEAQRQLNRIKRDYNAKKTELAAQGREKVAHIKLEMKIAKIEYVKTLAQWKACFSELNRAVPAAA